jgi:hypothetical protein
VLDQRQPGGRGPDPPLKLIPTAQAQAAGNEPPLAGSSARSQTAEEMRTATGTLVRLGTSSLGVPRS